MFAKRVLLVAVLFCLAASGFVWVAASRPDQEVQVSEQVPGPKCCYLMKPCCPKDPCCPRK
jgi:hypothetical protein